MLTWRGESVATQVVAEAVAGAAAKVVVVEVVVMMWGTLGGGPWGGRASHTSPPLPHDPGSPAHTPSQPLAALFAAGLLVVNGAGAGVAALAGDCDGGRDVAVDGVRERGEEAETALALPVLDN